MTFARYSFASFFLWWLRLSTSNSLAFVFMSVFPCIHHRHTLFLLSDLLLLSIGAFCKPILVLCIASNVYCPENCSHRPSLHMLPSLDVYGHCNPYSHKTLPESWDAHLAWCSWYHCIYREWYDAEGMATWDVVEKIMIMH